MNVLFVEPAFPANQREFVRALAGIGATVHGIGERPYDWLDNETRGWLAGYQQIASVTDQGALEWAVREAQGRFWVDRLEATVEAHILPAAHVRERTSIPGIRPRTAYLCRDKVAMKEVLRRAGVPTAASAGISSTAEAREFAREHGFPVIVKPRAGAGASGTFRAGSADELERVAHDSGLAYGEGAAIEEFIEGHEGTDEIFAKYGPLVVGAYFPAPGTATQGVEAGYMANAWVRVRHEDYDVLRAVLNEIGERIQVRAH